MDIFVIHVEQFVDGTGEKRSELAKASRVRIYDALRSSNEVVLLQRFDGRTLQGTPKAIEIYRRSTT